MRRRSAFFVSSAELFAAFTRSLVRPVLSVSKELLQQCTFPKSWCTHGPRFARMFPLELEARQLTYPNALLGQIVRLASALATYVTSAQLRCTCFLTQLPSDHFMAFFMALLRSPLSCCCVGSAVTCALEAGRLNKAKASNASSKRSSGCKVLPNHWHLRTDLPKVLHSDRLSLGSGTLRQHIRNSEQEANILASESRMSPKL